MRASTWGHIDVASGGRVLLIGGHVRSGTTLIRRLCNSHPDMAIAHELRCFAALKRSYSAHARYLLDDCWKRARRVPDDALKRFRLTSHYLWRLRRYHDRRSGGVQATAVATALRDLYPRKSIVGDKTPLYVFRLAELVDIPQVSILIVVRDARDVVSSTLERVKHGMWGTYWRNIGTAEGVAKRWNRSIVEMERYRDKIQVIRYEDLVRRPTDEINRLAAWLDLDPAGFPADMIRSSSVGKYKQRLTQDEVERVVDIAGAAMARIGYV
jgi:hypothetical protein